MAMETDGKFVKMPYEELMIVGAAGIHNGNNDDAIRDYKAKGKYNIKFSDPKRLPDMPDNKTRYIMHGSVLVPDFILINVIKAFEGDKPDTTNIASIGYGDVMDVTSDFASAIGLEMLELDAGTTAHLIFSISPIMMHYDMVYRVHNPDRAKKEFIETMKKLVAYTPPMKQPKTRDYNGRN